jgi:hypothetical protein
MLRFVAHRLAWIFALAFGLAATPGYAQEIKYRYVSLDQLTLPAPHVSFYPSGIQNGGRVYGTLCDATCTATALAFFDDGSLNLLPPVPPGSFGGPVNARGTIGGSVTDPATGAVHAALFKGERVEIVPPQPNEAFAFVLSLNAYDVALVQSFDAAGVATFVLYSRGKANVLNFGPTIPNPLFIRFNGVGRWINDEGIIAGTNATTSLYLGATGFRFDPRSGSAALLNPFPGDPTETAAWGQGINNRGDVLGYSFVGSPSSAPYHERIGVWDRNGVFQTYFVETINSSQLLFNNNNQIVITLVSPPSTSYLIPTPGVRLDLATLDVNLPAGQNIAVVTAMDDQGDMIGVSSTNNNFLLQRFFGGKPFDTPVVTNQMRPIPLALAAFQRRSRPQLNELK